MLQWIGLAKDRRRLVKCQMALRFFLVTQTSFEEGATQTHGDFVIDTPFSTQGEILESPTDDDAKQIGLRLGIISDPEGEMPLDVRYTLGPFEEAPADLPAAPTFTSEDIGFGCHEPMDH